MQKDSVQEIKEKLDLKDVVADYVQLQKRGVNYAARCPFHNEKTPSFFVSPARQVWRCFGCGEGGDHFTFIEKIEGVEFAEALRMLASKSGVEIRRQDPKIRSEKSRSLEINELAAKYFNAQLNSKNGQKIKEYLTGRGINVKSIDNFQIGYAPHNGRLLIKFLTERGYEPHEIEKAGLSFALRKSGEHVCRFRGRIIFPIFNAHGDVVGFGGRILTDELAKKLKKEVPQDTGKYINTPQTHIYDKSNILYGLHLAKMPIRKRDAAVVVEGYTDAILAHQEGCDNVVAASGTALTEGQLNLLGRFSKNLFTAFDMDIAGDTATKRGIDLAQNLGYNIKVVTLPNGKDPAEVIQKDPQIWKQQLEKAQNVVEFYYNGALAKYDVASAEGKRQIGATLAPVIASIFSRIEQAHWVQKLANNLKVSQDDVWEEVRKARMKETPQNNGTSPERAISQLTRKELLVQQILLAFLQMPEMFEQIRDEEVLTDVDVFECLRDIYNQEKKQFNIQKLQQNERMLIDQLLLEAEVHNRTYTHKDLAYLLSEYKKILLNEELRSIGEQIHINESEGKSEENVALLLSFQKKAEKLSQLNYEDAAKETDKN